MLHILISRDHLPSMSPASNAAWLGSIAVKINHPYKNISYQSNIKYMFYTCCRRIWFNVTVDVETPINEDKLLSDPGAS